jgi:hypothetical protein
VNSSAIRRTVKKSWTGVSGRQSVCNQIAAGLTKNADTFVRQEKSEIREKEKDQSEDDTT